MDTPEAIRELVRAEFLGRDAKEFVPCAVFDEPLDCIRVVTRDCSVTEWRVNDLLTVLEDNYPASPSRKYVGFTIKGARYLCQENAIPLSSPIRLSDILDAVLRVSPEMVVQFAVNAIARPMVEEVDRVDLTEGKVVSLLQQTA